MGNYAHQRLTPMQKPEWNSLMLKVERHDHRAFLATLYYWALRNGEARTLEAKHFIIEDEKIYQLTNELITLELIRYFLKEQRKEVKARN